MIGLRKLKTLLSDDRRGLGKTVHDRVRETLKSDHSDDEYRNITSPVHKNIAYAEERLAELLEESEKKARETLTTMEELNSMADDCWLTMVDQGGED